eukprot:TRINITY_DN10128_c0_g1_i1.p1 TRINITY_DN10128_c0_g1~~TRINITY_DN10128_c0_g1_i1.p1  ORF type:complete len:214 (+),score=9.89 TRINITY_DN10128_c0_g1_i1:32-643(+)
MKCRKDVKLAAAYKSYVAVESYEKEQLKEALLTKGPMTVSISADDPGFKFYQSGIFYAPNCTQSPYIMLDHAVMLSGYGRDPESGRNYWILKNIWSTFWGEQGYMRIDMDNNDCGVTALPQYTELDVEKTDKLRAQAAMAQRAKIQFDFMHCVQQPSQAGWTRSHSLLIPFRVDWPTLRLNTFEKHRTNSVSFRVFQRRSSID